MTEQIINIERMEQILDVFGEFDANIRLLETELGVKVSMQNGNLRISGETEDVLRGVRAVETLMSLSARGEHINAQTVGYVLSLVREEQETHVQELAHGVVCVTIKGKPIKAKTLGQKKYLDAIRKNTITFGIGPAGTGKTYLAVAMAVAAFRDKQINRLIITRPAIEAGEKLGFLPGDLQSKVDPYLRPLYDALFDMLGSETYHRYVERGNIEVAPLAYMRGRTLDDSFIILDEAQNTTPEQMKMFLTRLGAGSKAVVNGDIKQIDLPPGKLSGLKDAVAVLDDVPGIAVCHLTDRDVVRHELVQRIIRAYEAYDQRKKKYTLKKKP